VTKGLTIEVIYYFRSAVEAMEVQDYDTAIVWIKKAITSAPDVADFNVAMAECMCHLQRFETATQFAKVATELDPTYASGWEDFLGLTAVRKNTKNASTRHSKLYRSTETMKLSMLR
jgi:thioredoxin-like negative regulator of GroEL